MSNYEREKVHRNTNRQGYLKTSESRMAEDLCRELGISIGTFYKWHQKYGSLQGNELKKIKELKVENSKRKRTMVLSLFF